MDRGLIVSIIIISIAGLGILVPGCTQTRDWVLNVSFELNEREEYPRSDQLVIWLEKPDGAFVKSLYVSEYLSYGGYNDPDICPGWTTKANWEEASQEEFDAVTGATPAIGPVQMKVTLPADQLPKGAYNILIEVHQTTDYNELYTGLLQVSRRRYNNQLEVSYKPERYPRSTYDVLSNVKIGLNE